MNNTLDKALWSLGSIAVALILVGVFHLGGPVQQAFGTIAAGITNLTGLSITGTPGSFDVSGTSTFTGTVTQSSATEVKNGVTTVTQRSAMITASTTPCALQAPSATSTLLVGSASFVTSTTTATTITVAKATTPYATTTLLGSVSLGAGAQGTIVIASSTPVSVTNAATLDGLMTFAPSTYLVVGIANAVTSGDLAGTGFKPSGVCTATFRQVN